MVPPPLRHALAALTCHVHAKRSAAHVHFAAILIMLRLYKQVERAKAVADNVERAGGSAMLLNPAAAAAAGAAPGKQQPHISLSQSYSLQVLGSRPPSKRRAGSRRQSQFAASKCQIVLLTERAQLLVVQARRRRCSRWRSRSRVLPIARFLPWRLAGASNTGRAFIHLPGHEHNKFTVDTMLSRPAILKPAFALQSRTRFSDCLGCLTISRAYAVAISGINHNAASPAYL
jgi:hypothetical protein